MVLCNLLIVYGGCATFVRLHLACEEYSTTVSHKFKKFYILEIAVLLMSVLLYWIITCMEIKSNINVTYGSNPLLLCVCFLNNLVVFIVAGYER
jgi:hypothetical protein